MLYLFKLNQNLNHLLLNPQNRINALPILIFLILLVILSFVLLIVIYSLVF